MARKIIGIKVCYYLIKIYFYIIKYIFKIKLVYIIYSIRVYMYKVITVVITR